MKTFKKITIIGLMAMLLAAPIIATTSNNALAAATSTVTRSFSSLTPAAGSTLTVTLDVSLTASDTYYLIDETIPTGWVISNPGSGDISQAGHLKWVVITGAASTTYQYTVTVPSLATGLNAFSGIYGTESVTETAILGPTDITVQPATVTYTLTSLTGANGTISPLGATVVNSGSNQAFAITPDTGYDVADVLVDGLSVGAVTTYTFMNVIANHTIDVNFTAIPSVLTTITVLPATSTTTVGGTQQFTATAYDQFGAAMNPQPIFTWTSSDTNMVTIDQTGLATGVAVCGPTTITATSGAVSGTASLTVTALSVIPTTIVVNPITDIYGNTVVLTAVLSPTLSGKSIGFTLNGTAVGSAVTDASGIATTSIDLVGINAGTYPTGINANFAGDIAYASSSATEALTINKKPITVTATTESKAYDGTVTSTGIPTITSGALVGTDTVAWAQIFNNKNVGAGKSLIPFGTVNDGNGGNNYTVTFVNDITGAIISKSLTITANNANKTFGATLTFSGFEFTSNGLVAGDSITSITLTSDGTAASAATSTYPIIPSLAAGIGINNYAISYVNGVLTVNDNQTPIIIWINPIDITYPAPLSLTQLNATSSVPGTFVYTPAEGTILNVGNNQGLLAQFTPDDAATYNQTSASALINVLAPDYSASSSDLSALITSGSLIPDSGSVSTLTPSLTATSNIIINVPDEGNISQIILPYGTIISSIDGSLIDASAFSANDATSNPFVGLGNGVVVNGALQWGITNLGLQFSSPILINMFVGASFNGQTLNIVRSVSGADGWTSDGIVNPATCVVANGLCTFQATKASYYAATTPIQAPAPTPASSGGGGGGSIGGAVINTQQSSAPSTTTQSPTISFPSIIPSVLGAKAYADGQLIRGADKKIYVIVNGMKKHIKSLAELKSYHGKQLYFVTDDILASYPNSN
ncbi:Ig-like domain-containing protein [Candidatus Falkowbacteria bacterium]|nr:Ig-like domain-containing protein [Candidatus Falkowbacteria bacterium]